MIFFCKQIEQYNNKLENLNKLSEVHVINGWLAIQVKPLQQSLSKLICKWIEAFKKQLLRYVQIVCKVCLFTNLLLQCYVLVMLLNCIFSVSQSFQRFIADCLRLLDTNILPEELGKLLNILHIINYINKREDYADQHFKMLKSALILFKIYNVEYNQELNKLIDNLPRQWHHLQAIVSSKSESLDCHKKHQKKKVSKTISIHICYLQSYIKSFKKSEVCRHIIRLIDCIHY